MDISELQLKINKNQAVNDLKAVEGQLDKTGEAATGLIDTLKSIGLTVRFATSAWKGHPQPIPPSLHSHR